MRDTKQYFGNYLGLCINNDDPEKRGRVQIFIPHVLPALYDDWNAVEADIKLLCVGDNLPNSLKADMVKKLMEVLPWAECASPVIGQASPGTLVDPGGANYFCQSPNPYGQPDVAFTGIGNTGTFSAGGGGIINNAVSGGVGGNWAGSLDKISQILPPGTWDPSSQKRPGQQTSSGNTSDHYQGNDKAYAVDLGLNSSFGGNSETATQTAIQITNNVLAQSGKPPITSWDAYKGSKFQITTPDNYRVQIIWESNVGGNHYDHIHVGVEYKGKLADLGTGGTGGGAGTGSTSSYSPALQHSSSCLRTGSGGQTPIPKQTPPVDDESMNRLGPDPAVAAGGGTLSVPGVGQGGAPGTSGGSSIENLSFRSNQNGVTLNIDTDGIGDPGFNDPTRQGQTSVPGLNANTQAFFVLPNLPEYYKYKGKVVYAVNNTTNKSILGIVGDYGPTNKGFGEMSLYAARQLGVWTDGMGNSANTDHDVEFLVFGDSPEFNSGFNPADLQAYGTSQNISANQASALQVGNGAPSPLAVSDPWPATPTINMNNMASGVFTYPNAGAQLWVFFREGNPRFPVYFAASYGQSEWQSVYRYNVDDKGIAEDIFGYKPVTTPQEQTISNQGTMKFGPGAIRWTNHIDFNNVLNDEQSIGMFHLDGSGINLGIGWDSYYSAYDRRDTIVGDEFKTVGGYSQQLYYGGVNMYIMGNFVFTVGSHTQSSINAANEINQIFENALKPLAEKQSTGYGKDCKQPGSGGSGGEGEGGETFDENLPPLDPLPEDNLPEIDTVDPNSAEDNLVQFTDTDDLGRPIDENGNLIDGTYFNTQSINETDYTNQKQKALDSLANKILTAGGFDKLPPETQKRINDLGSNLEKFEIARFGKPIPITGNATVTEPLE